MALTLVGSDGGDWTVDLDLVPNESWVISCGLSHEISFDIGMIQLKNCKVIGVDPTEKARETVNHFRSVQILNDSNYVYIDKALYNESNLKLLLDDYKSVFDKCNKEVSTITLQDITKQYNPISVLKLDIEASEYPVIYGMESLEIPQICIEFHHWLKNIPYTFRDSISCIDKIKGFGYKLVYKKNHTNHYDNDPLDELLFIRNDLAGGYRDILIS